MPVVLDNLVQMLYNVEVFVAVLQVKAMLVGLDNLVQMLYNVEVFVAVLQVKAMPVGLDNLVKAMPVGLDNLVQMLYNVEVFVAVLQVKAMPVGLDNLVQMLYNVEVFVAVLQVKAMSVGLDNLVQMLYNVEVFVAVLQVKAMPVGLDNLVLVDEETQERTFKVGSQGGGGADTSGRKYRCGELEWEALMRTLDNSGFRTGHIYKQPLMKQEKKERANSDVELPPTSSSFTYVFDGDYEHSKYVSPIKMAMERQKQAYKAGWLTSPNTYKKTEIEEIGTTTPKKITKWVTDGENPQHRSTAIKVETPNQFAPQGVNPKEFKQKQKSIRKDYYEEKVSAGPQSKILEGISWDEASKMKEGGDQTVVVGAASKGIIQRDHQHNAVVYRSYYAANPFENMSEEEVRAYKMDVERQDRGEEPEDAPGPDGRLISTEERMHHIQQSREDVQHDTEDHYVVSLSVVVVIV
ncbi:protein hu-li tai shao-like [Littorina saxatilis]|uniref:protein hu-li tai shao-like n=1 Tax=Littorina saxatilis TaxID=31220 RepID=UPI0038B4197C